MTLAARVGYSHRVVRAVVDDLFCSVINYTDHLTRLMHDIALRVPTLSFINIRDVLVFARSGRSNADDARHGYVAAFQRREKLGGGVAPRCRAKV